MRFRGGFSSPTPISAVTATHMEHFGAPFLMTALKRCLEHGSKCLEHFSLAPLLLGDLIAGLEQCLEPFA